ncbi:MAG: ABC transporter permease, partial [bacterium]|nr:ABC transporter permease [bacterium]
MFKSYVTVAIRSMLRQRFHSAINILGLAIGMTCVILIAMYIRWELGFNTQFPNTDRLYRVVRSTVSSENQLSYTTRTSGALAGVLQDEYPEVLNVTRLFRREVFVTVGDKALSQLFCLADDNVFDTFPHAFKMGDAATLVRSPGSLVISQTLAQKLFGDRDPVGQTLKIDETGLSAEYRVCGVFVKANNSTIQFDLLATLSSAARVHHHWANWRVRGYRFVE